MYLHRTATGVKISLDKMALDHLINTIRMIDDGLLKRKREPYIEEMQNRGISNPEVLIKTAITSKAPAIIALPKIAVKGSFSQQFKKIVEKAIEIARERGDKKGNKVKYKTIFSSHIVVSDDHINLPPDTGNHWKYSTHNSFYVQIPIDWCEDSRIENSWRENEKRIKEEALKKKEEEERLKKQQAKEKKALLEQKRLKKEEEMKLEEEKKEYELLLKLQAKFKNKVIPLTVEQKMKTELGL